MRGPRNMDVPSSRTPSPHRANSIVTRYVRKYDLMSPETLAAPSGLNLHHGTPELDPQQQGQRKSVIRQSFRNLISIFKKTSPSHILLDKAFHAGRDTKPSIIPRDVSNVTPNPNFRSQNATSLPTVRLSGRLFYRLMVANSTAGVDWIECVATLERDRITLQRQAEPKEIVKSILLQDCTAVRPLKHEQLPPDDVEALELIDQDQAAFNTFELVFESHPGRERFAAVTPRQRAGWISTILDSILFYQGEHREGSNATEFPDFLSEAHTEERSLPPTPSPESVTPTPLSPSIYPSRLRSYSAVSPDHSAQSSAFRGKGASLNPPLPPVLDESLSTRSPKVDFPLRATQVEPDAESPGPPPGSSTRNSDVTTPEDSESGTRVPLQPWGAAGQTTSDGFPFHRASTPPHTQYDQGPCLKDLEKNLATLIDSTRPIPDMRQTLEDLTTQMKDGFVLVQRISEAQGRDHNLEPVNEMSPSADETGTMILAKLDELFLRETRGKKQEEAGNSGHQLQEVLRLLNVSQDQHMAHEQQQAESVRYLNELNSWLEAFVSNGTSQIQALAAGVNQLTQELGAGPVLRSHPSTLPSNASTTNLASLQTTVLDLVQSLKTRPQAVLNTGPLTELLTRQHKQQRAMFDLLSKQISEEIRGERLRFVDAMKEATAINVQAHLEQFKTELRREVGGMTTEVSRLHQEKQRLENKIADLFAFYSKQQAGLAVGVPINYTNFGHGASNVPAQQVPPPTRRSHSRPLPVPQSQWDS